VRISAPQASEAASATLVGARRVERAIARLQALPAFYPPLQKALRLLEDPDSRIDYIHQVICSDQAMASRILRLVNSAYFAVPSEVRTISLAITLAGRDRIAALLRRFLSEELLAMLSNRKPAAGHVRETSLVTAAAASCIAERLLRSDCEEILLAGLLHNIGELVFLSQFRENYEETLRLAGHMALEEAERIVFGVESRVAGKWLLEAWNFPPPFPAVAEHCADPWGVHFAAAPLAVIVIVHTARKLADAWVADARRGRAQQGAAAEAASAIAPRALAVLGVDRCFLADIYRDLGEQIQRRQSLWT
jgi:HD-like signal output (HDOD) protein